MMANSDLKFSSTTFPPIWTQVMVLRTITSKLNTEINYYNLIIIFQRNIIKTEKTWAQNTTICLKSRRNGRNKSIKGAQTTPTKNSSLLLGDSSILSSVHKKRTNLKKNTVNTKVAVPSFSSSWPTWNTDSVIGYWTPFESTSSRKWGWKWPSIRKKSIGPKMSISKTLEKKKLLTSNTQFFLAISISRETLVRLLNACTKKINPR